MVADLGITVAAVIKPGYKEDGRKIEGHIRTLEQKCD